jgi:hypothetical protein
MSRGKIKKRKKISLTRYKDIKDLIDLLRQPTPVIAEVLTGLLASGPADWKLSTGKIVQALIKGNLLTQLGREIKKYQEKGKIKEDYLETDISRVSFKELLSFIDEEVPDKLRFKAIKSIFLYSISKNVSPRDQVLAYELMKICKKLSSGDILVLLAIWKLRDNKTKSNNPIYSATEWLKEVAVETGHNLAELVEIHERKLIELRLISNRIYPDKSGVSLGKYFRLTDLGVKLCEFISKYE